jgi:hypothetical protein
MGMDDIFLAKLLLFLGILVGAWTFVFFLP